MFDVPVLRIEQLSWRLEYEISDGGERLLARVDQVAGPEPRKGLAAAFRDSGLGEAYVELRVGGPDGTPLFFVTRHGGYPEILDADRTPLGRIDYDEESMVREMSSEVGALASLRRTLVYRTKVWCERLLDAEGRPLCRLRWTMGHPGNDSWSPLSCDYTDMEGLHIAELEIREGHPRDSYRLQLEFRLPEPLRTLVIASPLAFDLSRT
ncbi:hypothetical protein [Actinomadura terrae]|uniref:hypothetical protein n=1 Tax=Actinomadura terrae TaxID=604353 RepID=UPI001FA73C03|nr:hypothetical protein [Actinomadura terrae]